MQPGGGGAKAAFYNQATIPFHYYWAAHWMAYHSFLLLLFFPPFNSIRQLDWQKIIIASPGLIIKNQPLFHQGILHDTY